MLAQNSVTFTRQRRIDLQMSKNHDSRTSAYYCHDSRNARVFGEPAIKGSGWCHAALGCITLL